MRRASGLELREEAIGREMRMTHSMHNPTTHTQAPYKEPEYDKSQPKSSMSRTGQR